jgi:hypothetical protein
MARIYSLLISQRREGAEDAKGKRKGALYESVACNFHAMLTYNNFESSAPLAPLRENWE